MRVVKKINNNVAICVDNDHHELIAFGKGIGFPPTPYELTDLSKITRTYYGVNAAYLGLLNEIPEDIFEISAKIVDHARTLIDKEINPNIVFTLADHIHFAIQRQEKNMNFKIPIAHDIHYLYEEEFHVGERAVAYINKIKHIHLSMDEATGIALHFINAENVDKTKTETTDDEQVIAHILSIIERDFDVRINRKSFNYSRFVSHMHYLLKRKDERISISSENKKLFEAIKADFKDTYTCVMDIKAYLKEIFAWDPGEEELLYLMLHINRLCAREDCNQ